VRACTVIVDGAAVRFLPDAGGEAEGAKVVTVEGLSNDADLTPLQKSFRKHHASAMRLLHAGMITTAHALLSEEPDCDAARVREVLPATSAAAPAISDRRSRAHARRSYKQGGARTEDEYGQLLHGSPVERREHLRFLRGRGQYVDDLARKDTLYAPILRSSIAHGRIRAIDTSRRQALTACTP